MRLAVVAALARVGGEARVVELARLDDELVRRLRALGFTYVALDLQGFRSGSMNEVTT
ncbi:MAG TPA: hypothetical protein VJ787_05080 [Thermoleophilia bacterium]|nr:hypothetical protein [Thermoleophilia bacterium]